MGVSLGISAAKAVEVFRQLDQTAVRALWTHQRDAQGSTLMRGHWQTQLRQTRHARIRVLPWASL
jgi:hypothetical protein